MALFWKQCATGGVKGVRAALAQGQDINAGCQEGWTGLMIALIRKQNSVVKLLLQHSVQRIF